MKVRNCITILNINPVRFIPFLNQPNESYILKTNPENPSPWNFSNPNYCRENHQPNKWRLNITMDPWTPDYFQSRNQVLLDHPDPMLDTIGDKIHHFGIPAETGKPSQKCPPNRKNCGKNLGPMYRDPPRCGPGVNLDLRPCF